MNHTSCSTPSTKSRVLPVVLVGLLAGAAWTLSPLWVSLVLAAWFANLTQLTGLIQGVVATIAYFALSIPSALGLGIVTAAASLIPSVGTALIWVPVAIGLGLSGRWGAAGILAAIGVFIIGTVDNILRPVLSRYGQLELPTFVLFLAIFGGITLYGAAGIILGPLLVRLGVEALAIAYAEGLTASDSSAPSALRIQPSEDQTG